MLGKLEDLGSREQRRGFGVTTRGKLRVQAESRAAGRSAWGEISRPCLRASFPREVRASPAPGKEGQEGTWVEEGCGLEQRGMWEVILFIAEWQ